jgi:zinc protease
MLRELSPGVAALTGECLDEGAGGRSGAEISKATEARGAVVGAGAVGGNMRCLVRDFKPCLGTLADLLRRPDFPADAFEKKRTNLVSELMAEDDEPMQKGRNRLRAEIYGAHPYARRDKGSVDAMRAITRDAVMAHHAAFFVPRNTILSCVGDLPLDEMEAALVAAFGSWEDRAPPLSPVPTPDFPLTGRDIAITEDRDQLHILMGHLGIRRTHPDFHALLVGDLVLGSGAGFTDRLSKKLRDEMGLAYSVSARIARSADIEPGTFSAYIGTSPQTKDIARDGMMAEIRRFVDGGPTEAEVTDAKNYLLGSYVFGFETGDGTAENLLQMERLGLGFDEPANFARAVSAVTAQDVAAAVKRHIFPDRLITVMVGRV